MSLTRDVFVVPLIDFVGSHVVWRLKKPIYGIVSDPKSWFYRLIEVCRASGLTTATTDEGLLIMTSGEQVVGVLALHVDVSIGGGTEEFHGMMAKISEALAVGSHETSNFRYKGLRVSTAFKISKPCLKSTSTATTTRLLVGLCTCHWGRTRISCRCSQ
jgi:hypothetical protein